MHVLNVRNADQALVEATWYLHVAGLDEESRNGAVRVAPGPVCTVYERPLERVLFHPTRDANPFFHFMEALWMLAGRNDVAAVKVYNSRIDKYSDDGEVLHGAYGFRWREWFSFDQLPQLVQLLRADPETRRAVLGMWSPSGDLVASEGVGGIHMKDVPCLAGDTLIWSPEGDKPISEVAKLFSSGKVKRWPVYAVHSKTKELRLRWATNVWKSGRKKTVKIIFDDGSSIRCTPDHVLYKRAVRAVDAAPIAAGALMPGDRVLATQRWHGPKGYELVKKQLGKSTRFSNMQKTHVEYATLLHGTVPPGHVVHHDNDIVVDNRGENLRVWLKSKHDSHHRLGDRNPMRRMTAAQHRQRAAKHSASLKRSWVGLTAEERSARARGVDNHVVVSVEACSVEDVYDFTVPGEHTALIGTGVVAHNCNTHAYFDLRGGKLNMTVLCRSNDAIWGAYGANVVHFSLLLEYVAAHLGVPVGVYRQFSNNLHVYKSLPNYAELMPLHHCNDSVLYDTDAVKPCPLLAPGESMADFDEDLEAFFQPLTVGKPPLLSTSFFRYVAAPMRATWETRRKGRGTGLLQAERIEAMDWRRACIAWINRRETAKSAKAGGA